MLLMFIGLFSIISRLVVLVGLRVLILVCSICSC